MLHVLENMGVAHFATRTFYRHQKAILQPSVDRVWDIQQTSLIAALCDQEEIIIGGGRKADSPGHSAIWQIHNNGASSQ